VTTDLTVQFVDLERQYRSIKSEIDATLLRIVASTDYILGDELRGFEEAFAEYCGTRHCIGVGSGTAALHLALEALGIGEGDEVVVPANTFIATVLPVMRLGATPVFVDCTDDTATIDVDSVAAALSERTRAILAVHLYGQPADVDALAEVSQGRGVVLIEDACQAHGARYKGRRVGGLGIAAAFSFYPAKNLGAYGDAGAITTDDDDLAEHARLLRDLGQERKYVHVVQGWNERLDTIQAAVLRVKLAHLDRWNELRREHAATYGAVLADSGLRLPETALWAEHVFHLYVVRAARRDALREALKARGIATGMHYPLPLPDQPALESLGYGQAQFPVTAKWAREVLSLPMFPELERSEIERVAEAITAWGHASSSGQRQE
jgi:dTDP-4-amino-4,6-dideoxygalactose transaminase